MFYLKPDPKASGIDELGRSVRRQSSPKGGSELGFRGSRLGMGAQQRLETRVWSCRVLPGLAKEAAGQAGRMKAGWQALGR